MTDKKDQKKKISFEEKIKELEQLVQELEKGDISLDDSLNYFEKGIKLYQDCRGVLDHAQKRVEILTETFKQETD